MNEIISLIFDDLEPFIGQLVAVETWIDEIIDARKQEINLYS